MESRDDFTVRWVKMQELRKEALRKNFATVFPALKKLDVSKVVMTYYGGGDSGDYHYPIYSVGEKDLESRAGYGPTSHTLDVSGEFTTDVKVSVQTARYGSIREDNTYGEPYIDTYECSLVEAVYSLLTEAVEEEHGGWYNNEGGEGTVTLLVPENRIDVEHGDYIRETAWNCYSVSAE